MEDFYVYILKCHDGSYYTGHTDNISTRMEQHNNSIHSDSYVSKRLPVELVFADCVGTREAAKEAEWMIKGWSRKKKEALINGGWEALKGFNRKNKKNKV